MASVFNRFRSFGRFAFGRVRRFCRASPTNTSNLFRRVMRTSGRVVGSYLLTSGIATSVIATSNLASMVYYREIRKEISDASTASDAIRKGVLLGFFWPYTLYRLGKQVYLAYEFNEITFAYPLFILDFPDIYPAESFLLGLVQKIERGEITPDEAIKILNNMAKDIDSPSLTENEDLESPN